MLKVCCEVKYGKSLTFDLVGKNVCVWELENSLSFVWLVEGFC